MNDNHLSNILFGIASSYAEDDIIAHITDKYAEPTLSSMKLCDKKLIPNNIYWNLSKETYSHIWTTLLKNKYKFKKISNRNSKPE
jgi:hypothetical protein